MSENFVVHSSFRFLLYSLIICTFSKGQAIEIREVDKNISYQAQTFDSLNSENYFTQQIPPEKFLEFLELYANRPIHENVDGMRSQGIFFLWYLLKEINPELVIESGIFRGQSTWIIDQAAPLARLIAIDPNLQKRVYLSSKALYTTTDFSALSINSEGPVVCFFDDHIDAFERVLQAYRKGIKHLIFDDNYAPGYADCCGRHLTLRDCFEMKNQENKGTLLRKIVKHYYIMPQIVGNTAGNFCYGKPPATNIPSIWSTLEEVPLPLREKFELFANDSIWYRWLTYVELY